ncbi:MAG: Acylphosphatase [Candidatus Daviesbacteria bacterium GW2011_GWA1_41_61]|uniref:acylphosphatase n=1 Tax=Candidatus Daviesbacteria bacterium GW2011_GWA2_40_9 TaxID=1618424 RepID=A0A0G0X4C6_9BACT|nr:MAG: Acylphosphatase [Candidatus Daviesbacteria bacterium GW2011_GWC1_40_9]KKR82467.1 MAG: Acylphosphatase [Candidatus Daviesbacteria bacterium GW2011_GWA2_40_9]KKR93174.1 MAG: Acylphosphatase [Candidatus Daviesbacteria bacterium GW2011_GWB1_41_15]KKS15718.1 MAG: Acylphosphatase [Candidatus Daviesbacteria bacterium GW2011_GWA1_41_61]
MIKHFNIRIFGLVQGVFFRDFTRQQAEKLNIKGFGQNMPDGSVYIGAEGEPPALKEFIKWCQKGPPLAKVDRVEISEGTVSHFTEFIIS